MSLCKAKRQNLLTLQVSRCCLLALPCSYGDRAAFLTQRLLLIMGQLPEVKCLNNIRNYGGPRRARRRLTAWTRGTRSHAVIPHIQSISCRFNHGQYMRRRWKMHVVTGGAIAHSGQNGGKWRLSRGRKPNLLLSRAHANNTPYCVKIPLHFSTISSDGRSPIIAVGWWNFHAERRRRRGGTHVNKPPISMSQ